MSIPFTQYFLPDGRAKETSFESASEETEKKAHELIEKGCRFEAEILATGHVSLTVHYNDEDISIVFCPNGEEVVKSVDVLVKQAIDYFDEMEG